MTEEEVTVVRKRGRPKGSLNGTRLSEEERRKRQCEASKRCYYKNYEYRNLQKQLYYRRKKEENKNKE